jgi:hypothetical protein
MTAAAAAALRPLRARRIGTSGRDWASGIAGVPNRREERRDVDGGGPVFNDRLAPLEIDRDARDAAHPLQSPGDMPHAGAA